MPTDLAGLVSPEERAFHEDVLDTLHKEFGEAAPEWERQRRMPREALAAVARLGLLAPGVPVSRGGAGRSSLEVGLALEAAARLNSSLAAVMNVQNMVVQSLRRWADEEPCGRVLTGIADGDLVAAVAITEPEAGSDLAHLRTRFEEDGKEWRLTGRKTWITYGEFADVYLVVAAADHGPVACLVERGPGVTVSPVPGLLGLRAAHLATVDFDGCVVGESNLVGRPGFGLTVVAGWALMHGRLGIAWMATGLLQASLAAGSAHALERRTFGRPIIEHGQIRSSIAAAGTDLQAARRLCVGAARATDSGDPVAADDVLVARYFSCRAAAEHARQAVQILGAAGCLDDGVVARCYRDAKVLEILDGTTEIMELLIAETLARGAIRSS